jgi:predicted nuclease of predicted toxin-antitoxin system
VSTRVKIDEDLPRQIADLIAAQGHDAATVVEQGWQGVSDDDLWPRVQGERRWLVTADKGFADLRRHPPGSHAGVILLRAQEESRRAYMELAAIALERLKLDEISGAVVVVTYRGVRIRRAPAF